MTTRTSKAKAEAAFDLRKAKAEAAFDLRVKHTPISWQQPLADVIDTFDAVQLGLKSIGIDDPFVLMKAVELVIERHDRLTAECQP